MADNEQQISNLKNANGGCQEKSKFKSRPDQKNEKSSEFFKGTRISSCAYVKMKGGQPVAVPYYEKPQPSSAETMMKSTYTKSFSQ